MPSIDMYNSYRATPFHESQSAPRNGAAILHGQQEKV